MGEVIGGFRSQDGDIHFVGSKLQEGICMDIATKQGPWTLRLTTFEIRQMRIILREAQRFYKGKKRGRGAELPRGRSSPLNAISIRDTDGRELAVAAETNVVPRIGETVDLMSEDHLNVERFKVLEVSHAYWEARQNEQGQHEEARVGLTSLTVEPIEKDEQ